MVHLPDSTIVWLDGNADIKYASAYNENKRDIVLQGKAYFKVAKNPLRPFRVFVNNICVTALGTQFNIDQKVNTVRVSLNEGKVAVKNTSNGLDTVTKILYPGMELLVTNGTFSPAVQFDTLMRKNWINEDLYYKETTLDNVLEELQEQFGIPIEYNKTNLGKVYFSGHLSKKDGLQNILQSICHAYGLHCSFKINTYYITTR